MPLIDASAYVHPGYDARLLSGIIGIAVHHTVSGGQFIGIDNPALTEADEIAHIQMIDLFHRTPPRDWGGIGYSALIFASGRGYSMGPLAQVRAGVASRNYVIASFAFVGDFTDRWPTPKAMATSRELIWSWRSVVGVVPVKGHRDWAIEGWATSCPGDRWREWMPILTGLGEEDDDMADFNEAEVRRLAREEVKWDLLNLQARLAVAGELAKALGYALEDARQECKARIELAQNAANHWFPE